MVAKCVVIYHSLAHKKVDFWTFTSFWVRVGNGNRLLLSLLPGHEVRCIMVIENWSRWMLNFPVVYTQYGDFQYGFHEREIFPAHREIVVAVNELDSITGSSGTIAWELVRPVTKHVIS